MPDPLLATLIRATNDSEDPLGIRVTVTVPGGVIAGTLISMAQWLSEAAVMQLADGTSKSFFQPLLEEHVSARQLANEAEALPPVKWSNEQAKAHADWQAEVEHLHLSQARWISPAGRMPVNGMYWRGRLEHVSGWVYGELVTSD